MSEGQTGCFSLASWFKSMLQKKKNPPTSNLRDKLEEDCQKHSLEDDEESSYGRFNLCCDFSSEQTQAYFPTLDKSPPYSKLDICRPEVAKSIEAVIDKFDSTLRKLSLIIHDHPEIAFKEKFAHDTLTAFMSNHGFSVTRHYLGLETAWRAEFTNGKGGRTIGINSEMDALPGLGHACGHNLIAISGVGVALAIQDALQVHGVAGRVVLLGTPGVDHFAFLSVFNQFVSQRKKGAEARSYFLNAVDIKTWMPALCLILVLAQSNQSVLGRQLPCKVSKSNISAMPLILVSLLGMVPTPSMRPFWPTRLFLFYGSR